MTIEDTDKCSRCILDSIRNALGVLNFLVTQKRVPAFAGKSKSFDCATNTQAKA
jgi:hypothetical protein